VLLIQILTVQIQMEAQELHQEVVHLVIQDFTHQVLLEVPVQLAQLNVIINVDKQLEFTENVWHQQL